MLTSCCCGCNLRRGSLFIGWISLIFQTLSLFLFIGGLVLVENEDSNAITTLNFDSDIVTTSPLWNEEEGDSPKLEIFNDDDFLKPQFKIEIVTLDGKASKTEELSEMDDFEILNLNFDDIFKNHMLFGLNLLLNDMNDEVFNTKFETNSRRKRDVEIDDAADAKYDAPVFIAGIVGSAIQIITSILLIVGVKAGHMNSLIPWMCSTFIVIVLDTVHVVYCLLNLSDHEVDTLLDVVFIGIYMYMLMIVYSHYKELKELKKKKNLDLKEHPCECPWASSDISILPITEKKMEKH